MGVDPKDTVAGYDAEKNQALLKGFLDDFCGVLSDEIGSLLGRVVNFSDVTTSLMTAEEFGKRQSGKRVVAAMSFAVAEDEIGQGYFICSVKDAVTLGGIFAVLADEEFEKAVQEEDLSNDLKNAYGEIANVVSALYSRVFEEKYTPVTVKISCREILEMELAEEKDGLLHQVYYCEEMSVALEDSALGKFQMLFPAEALMLCEKEFSGEDDAGEEAEGGKAADNGAEENTEVEEITYPLDEELERHQERIDRILEECRDRCQQEVSDLTGAEVELKDIENFVVSKESFFAKEVKNKQILALIGTRVEDDYTCESFLVVDIKAAIQLGGVLVMLPPTELQAAVKRGAYNDDIADAYGEVANIITGAYTSTLEEMYKKEFHLVRKELSPVNPPAVDPASDEPFADGYFYLTRMSLFIDGTKFRMFNFLFPLEALNLQGLLHERSFEEVDGRRRAALEGKEWVPEGQKNRNISFGEGVHGEYNILLIGDDEDSAVMISESLSTLGLVSKRISFKDDIMSFLGAQVRAVYLVLEEINDQAFGMVIKVSAGSSVPIIVAAPAWTRSKVVKAVKYGVQDILVTPATSEEIALNIQKNIN